MNPVTRFAESGGHQEEKPGIQQLMGITKLDTGIIVKHKESGTQLEFDTIQKSNLVREMSNSLSTIREQTVIGIPIESTQKRQQGKLIR